MSEANRPMPSVIPSDSQTTKKAAAVDVNEIAARERAMRDAREQALQAKYRAEAERAAYQAQVQQQGANPFAESARNDPSATWVKH